MTQATARAEATRRGSLVHVLKSAFVTLLAVLTSVLLLVPGAEAATTVGNTPLRSWSLNGRVYASVVVGSRVILGGAFTTATSPSGTTQAASHLAAFDLATGARVTGFTATADGDVRALVSNGTTLYVGGAFLNIDSVARNRLAAVDATTGALRPGFTASATARVVGMDLRGNELYVGGDFTSLGNGSGPVARSRVGALDATTGAVDPTFVASADNRVAGVRVSPTGSTVYLAGSFTQVGGVARAGLAAVNGTTGATTGVVFARSVAPTLSLDLSPDGSTVYAGQGGTANSAVAWRASTGTRLWSVTTDGDVQAVRYGAGRLFLGFHDGYQGVTTTKLLSANPTTGAVDASFHPVFDGFWGTFALAVTSGYLIDGGEFTKVGGVAAGDWARFPITTS